MKLKLLVIVLAFIYTGCTPEKKSDPNIPDQALDPDVINNPATASGNSKDNVPVIVFDFDTHDFGTLDEGEKVSYAFKFTNTGKGDLVIRHAQGSCGCTVPEFPKEPIHPGGTGIVNVTFNSEGKEGNQNKTVTIISNTIPNTKVINITAKVIKSK